jgi:hypothetical protein
MATVKLAIWLYRNGRPLPINAQKIATSSSGAIAVAMLRFNISLFSGRGAHLFQKPFTAGVRTDIINSCVSAAG